MPRTIRSVVALAAGLLLAAVHAWPEAQIQVVTDGTSYNVGSEVRIKAIFPVAGSFVGPSAMPRGPMKFVARLRYAGENQPVVDQIPLPTSLFSDRGEHPTRYVGLWTIPLNARTGRYEIEVEGRDARSHKVVLPFRGGASFVVHRKPIRIARIQLDKTFYTSGDAVACVVTLKNLTDWPFTGLRVEFSDRYWPWTAQSSRRAGVDFVSLAESLSLATGEEKEVRAARAAVAAVVKQPAASQYAVVVWDHERKNILDIAFSPLVFIHPPGVDSPKPYAAPPGYPLQYLHPDLGAVNVSSYRHFYPSELDSPAIQFDLAHTMFPSGAEGAVSFSLHNPTSAPWRRVSVRARLLSPEGSQLASDSVAEAVDFDPHGSLIKERATFIFSADASGLYHAEVEVKDPSGEVLASNRLELGVNPLPKSILIFCAHEDDEGAHAGIIRAAVENHIAVHVVYFTSGDAGSCDRYYQHSCGPGEALNFGALRMDEARAALGHLGVPQENISFLGLPDGGSGQIWHHVEASNPYLAVLVATDHAPYARLARPNLPYARNPVVETAVEFIKKFQPDVIYTGHPDERHVDHRTNNWFVVKALQKLIHEGALSPIPTLLVDQSYGPGPQVHAPYRYQKRTLNVSGEAMALAQESRWYYQSQDGNRAEGNLHTLDQLRRTEVHWQVLDWQEHDGWNEKN